MKSPEEYLSALEFDAGGDVTQAGPLNAEERAFVEKYIGVEAIQDIPRAEPEPVPLMVAMEKPARPVLLAEKEIIVAPGPSPQHKELPLASTTLLLPMVREALPELIIVPDKTESQVIVEQAQEVVSPAVEEIAQIVSQEVINGPKLDVTTEPSVLTPIADTVEETKVATNVAVASEATKEAVEVTIEEKTAPVVQEAELVVAPPATTVHSVTEAKPLVAQLSPEALLREKLKQENEVQMVSFFVGGQLFLLPVQGIQEVLRHMELIKVPQAPHFVAGVINLRGRVTPIVHLSSLVTNSEIQPYTERNFIIITGSGNLQLGLIIDKVSSMHMVPQKKIIWNPESKLADAAEFLGAIVDLDDRVCGMVSPEMITRLILPES